MMEAMAKGDFGIQSGFEKRITDKVNEAEAGSLGLGGNHSVLRDFSKDRHSTCQWGKDCGIAYLLLL